jgi:hypothetical protein
MPLEFEKQISWTQTSPTVRPQARIDESGVNFHFINQIRIYEKECRCKQKKRGGVFAASEHGREALKQVALFGIVRSLIFGMPLDRQNAPPRGEFDGFDSSVFRVTGADLEPACKPRYRLVVP